MVYNIYFDKNSVKKNIIIIKHVNEFNKKTTIEKAN